MARTDSRWFRGNLAAMQIAMGDFEGAGAGLAEALAIQEKRLHADHPLLALTWAKRASVHHALRRDDLARNAWNEAIRIRRVARGSPRDFAETLYGFATFLSDLDECEEGMKALDEAVEMHRRHGIEDVAAMGRIAYTRGSCLERAGDLEAARARFRDAVELLERGGASNDERTGAKNRLEALDAGSAVD